MRVAPVSGQTFDPNARWIRGLQMDLGSQLGYSPRNCSNWLREQSHPENSSQMPCLWADYRESYYCLCLPGQWLRNSATPPAYLLDKQSRPRHYGSDNCPKRLDRHRQEILYDRRVELVLEQLTDL